MKRSFALAVGVPAMVMAALALGLGDVKAEEKAAQEKKVEKKEVEKKVRVVRVGAGGGFLGVGLEDVESGTRGAKVRSVDGDSPAAKAGLKEGDVIVRFDGETVRSASHLARLVRETPAGRSVTIEINRAGASQTLSAALGERRRHFMLGGDEAPLAEMPEFEVEIPEPPLPPRAPVPHVFRWRSGPGERSLFRTLAVGPRRLGVEYQEIEGQLAAYFKLADKRGVLVTSVDEESPAAKAGLEAGDVILKFGSAAIRDGDDLRDEVREAEAGQEITVTVQRDGGPLDLKVVLPKPERPRPHRPGVSL